MLLRALNREVYGGPWNPQGRLLGFEDWMIGYQSLGAEASGSLTCEGWLGPWHFQLCKPATVEDRSETPHQ